MTFEEWWETPKVCGDCFEDVARAAWDAATADVKKDHDRMGEDVEAVYYGGEYSPAIVVARFGGGMVNKEGQSVRRIPEWEPKDGEVVLAKSQIGYAFYAVSAGRRMIYLPAGVTVAGDIKPWKPDCQGLPWEQV